jgi:chromate transporter
VENEKVNDDPLLRLALGFGGLSLFAVGGALSMLSDIRAMVVDHYHWMSNADFAHLFAIAQIAPGPNILMVSLLGWHVAGLAGLAVTTLATLGPSGLFAFFVGRGFDRMAATAWFPAVRQALAPLVVGLYLASGLEAARAADQRLPAYAITAGVAAYVAISRYNPLWGLLAGAIAGVGLSALGWL